MVALVIRSAEEYCRTFDLTARIPGQLFADALTSGQLQCVNLARLEQPSPAAVTSYLTDIFRTDAHDANLPPLRICIPSLGSWCWKQIEEQVSQNFLGFIHLQRLMNRRYVGYIAFPPLPEKYAEKISPHLCICQSCAPYVRGDMGWYWMDTETWMDERCRNFIVSNWR